MPDWTPTWLREGFGFTVFDSCWGRDHPTRQILKAIHKANEQDLEVPDEILPEYEKGIYFSSWFTYIAGTFDCGEKQWLELVRLCTVSGTQKSRCSDNRARVIHTQRGDPSG
jgi:hypothetical protein